MVLAQVEIILYSQQLLLMVVVKAKLTIPMALLAVQAAVVVVLILVELVVLELQVKVMLAVILKTLVRQLPNLMLVAAVAQADLVVMEIHQLEQAVRAELD